MVIPGHQPAWRPWWGAGPVTRHFPHVHSEPGSHGSDRAACLASGSATSPLVLWSWGPPPPPALEEPQELWEQRLISESFLFYVLLKNCGSYPLLSDIFQMWKSKCSLFKKCNNHTVLWNCSRSVTLFIKAMQDERGTWNSVMTLITPTHTYTIHETYSQLARTIEKDMKKQQTQTHSTVSHTTTTFTCLPHLFNMCLLCLSAISGKLSVIMTGLYGRPCFQAFRCAMDSPFLRWMCH